MVVEVFYRDGTSEQFTSVTSCVREGDMWKIVGKGPSGNQGTHYVMVDAIRRITIEV